MALYRAPRGEWRRWATFYFFSGVLLKSFDSLGAGGAYYWVWMGQQIGSTAFLVPAVAVAFKPDPLAAVLSCAAAVCLGIGIQGAFRWPGEPIEYVTNICGVLWAAMGLYGACCLTREWRAFLATFAGYLLIGALLLFSTPAYMSEIRFGLDVASVDCLGFGVWTAIFWTRRKN